MGTGPSREADGGRVWKRSDAEVSDDDESNNIKHNCILALTKSIFPYFYV